MTKVTIDRELIEQAIAGAIFDFAGYLTSHPDTIEVGSAANAAVMVERIRAWAGYSGLSIENANVEKWNATLAEPDHWSDCAANSEPAYPAGACDCMPTPAMCRAAVEYVNGADVYEKVPREALDIEEGIYREAWIAMQAVAPPPPAEQAVEPVSLTTEEYTALAHRIASKYAHRSDPRHIAYTFLPHTLEQFVLAVEQLVRRKAGL